MTSIDLTPTLLGLLGFETESAGFDGVDVLTSVSLDRKIYFSGWMQEGPAGFVEGNQKFIYNPVSKALSVYDLGNDPLEQVRIELPEKQALDVVDEITKWRKGTIIRINQEKTGRKVLYDRWLCRWTHRVSSTKYLKQDRE